MASPVQVTKVHTYTGHKDAVYTLEQGGKPNTFYSAGGDGYVIEWDLNNFDSGRLIAKIPTSVYAVHYWETKNVLVVGQNYEGIHLIDLDDHREIGSVQLSKGAIFDIKVYNNLAVVAAADGELFVVDLDNLSIVKKSSIAEKNLRTILILGERCLIGTSEGQIVEIDLNSLQIINQKTIHENSVFTLAQRSPDDFIISGSRDARIKYWNAENLEAEEAINAHMYAINSISYHPAGPYFATGSMDKTIKIWNHERRKLIKVIDKARHEGHLTSVNKVLWTPHKDFLISCSDDRSIGVWDIIIPK